MTKKENHGIKKLTDYNHIRLRTEMYLSGRDPHTQKIFEVNLDGSTCLTDVTWVPSLFVGFREILDNAADEVIGHKHGNRIDVTYDPEKMIFSVKDNGRGIPFTYDEEHKTYLATMVLSEPRAGRNFEERGDVAGTNGIGASATSNTSEWFKVKINKDGKQFTQTFKEGKKDATHLIIEEPTIKDIKQDNGTFIEYTPSRKVYKHMVLPEEFMYSRIYEFAATNPNTKVYFNGKQIKVKDKVEKTLFPNRNTISIDINDVEQKFYSQFILVPGFVEDGDHYHSIVNRIPAFNGGTHMDAFRLTFVRNLLNSLAKESKRRKLTPNRADVTEGLLVYNVTKMNAPNFDAQSKTRLTNEEAGTVISNFLNNADFYDKIIKKNKEWIDEIYQRCEDRTHKKDASEIDKLQKKMSKVKVPSLMDATGKDRSASKLLICEGLSAVGGFSAVRNPKIHGSIPLRGKILNVNGMKPKVVLENKIIQDIMNALGLVIGQEAKLENLRYGEVWIATDEDFDGCFAGDTLIHTLEKGPVEIQNLKKEFEDGYFHVWSRTDDGKQVPGRAHSPRITKYVDTMYNITLDNGKVIQATANHPFRMVDGTYSRVDELSVGDSLSPFNSNPEYLNLDEKQVENWIKHYNHSIVKIDIIKLETKIPVWDITVDDYHNFALEAGCYVHNSSICSLLVNFFYTYWPELFKFDKPFISRFQTPFIIAEKGKQRKYWYSSNYHEFRPEDWKGWTITRAKGLGTLVKEDWEYSIKNPALIPITEDEGMEESLDMIFNGDRSDDRKVWMGV